MNIKFVQVLYILLFFIGISILLLSCQENMSTNEFTGNEVSSTYGEVWPSMSEKRNLFLGLALVTLVITSCKDEKVTAAEKSVDTYVIYVDSIGNIETNEVKANWQAIDEIYQIKVVEADLALENLKEKEVFEIYTKLNTSNQHKMVPIPVCEIPKELK